MKVLIFLMFGLVFSIRKILIGPYNWAFSHTQAAYILAERISNDPQYECYIVLYPTFSPPWPTKCNILYLSPLEEGDTFIEDLESLTLKSEEGLANSIDLIKGLIIHSFAYWQKSGVFSKLEKLGIDIGICDSTDAGCKVALSKLKIPFVMYLFPLCLPGILNHKVPITTSYVPIASINKVSSDMGFFKRFLNMLGNQILSTSLNWIDVDITNEYFPESVGYNDWKNESATKRNVIFAQACLPTFHFPELLPPNILNVGPILNRKVSPITEDVSSFINKYKGTILISFGSINKIANLDVIGQLCDKFPDFAFIMSYKEQLKDGYQVPSNLLILKWFKQADLLADKKTLAFISHTGWNSVAEAMLHAVPIVACGWSIDRDLNSLLIEKREIGLRIPTKSDFTVQNLEEKLLKVLNEKRFRENIEKYSRFLQKFDGEGKILEAIDLYFESGVDNLVIEQVYTMNWVQFFNLDVWLFEVLILLVVLFCIFKVMKGCFLFFFKKYKKQLQKNVKEE